MWKVKLDDDLWLGRNSETTKSESQAWLLPDMPAVQTQLLKVRIFMPYPNAMVIYHGNSPENDSRAGRRVSGYGQA